MTGPSARRTTIDALRAAGCVWAEDEADLLLGAAPGPEALAAAVARRAAGEPLEHVVGWAAFGGLRIGVDPGVFVPRRRTEFLAERAAAVCAPGAVVVELCCGAGAVGAYVLAAHDRITLYAADVDPAAVRCARRNLAGAAAVAVGDLYAPLPAELRGRVDLLVANAPYVPTDELAFLPAEARLYEHRVALDGGGDGLDLHRRIAEEAPVWLAPAGRLLIETSAHQAAVTAAAVADAGLSVEILHDEAREATVVLGRATTPGAARA